MLAGDMFAEAILFGGSLKQIITNEGMQKGLSSTELQRYVDAGLETPTDYHRAEALKMSHNAVWLDKPTPLRNNLISARENIPAAWVPVPFMNTLLNILSAQLERVPGVGLAYNYRAIKRGIKASHSMKAYEEYTRSGERVVPLSRALARQVTGTMLAAAIMTIFNDDDAITAAAPMGKNERALFYKQGKLPYSVKVNGRYFSYRWMVPFDGILSALAATKQVMKAHALNEDQEPATKAFGDFATVVTNTLVGSGFVGNVEQLFSGSGWVNSFAKFPAAMVPFSGMMKEFTRSIDTARFGGLKAKDRLGEGLIGNAIDAFWHEMANTIPFLRETLPDQVSVEGKVVKMPMGIFNHWLPFQVGEESQADHVENELARLGTYPKAPPAVIDGILLPSGLRRDLGVKFGVPLKQLLQREMNKMAYIQANDVKKREMLSRLCNSAYAKQREEAKRQFKLMGLTPMFE